MFSALLALLVLPFSDLSKLRGVQFRPLSKIAFFIFVANFLILMQLGAKHVESPFIELGQISTVLYFAHFLLIVPFITLLENSLIDLAVYNPIYLSRFQINGKKIEANRLSGFATYTLYPAGLATAFTVVIGLSSFVFALWFSPIQMEQAVYMPEMPIINMDTTSLEQENQIIRQRLDDFSRRVSFNNLNIMLLSFRLVISYVSIATNFNTFFDSDLIYELSHAELLHTLRNLQAWSTIHEAMFDSLTSYMSYLGNMNIESMELGDLHEQWRGIGNRIMEIYRNIEDELNISHINSEIPTRWFEG